jgi:RNA polymerase sigma-70 factor (ECF subfamily)
MATTNIARNSVRGTRRYRQLLERLPRVREAPDTAETVLESRALGVDSTLREGLRSLKPADAQLFALVALEGYSVADAAGALGLSESAARTRLHRTRTKLRAWLDDPGGAP